MLELAQALLFVPGDRPDRFVKAASSGADAVIIDLEDAVAPSQKGFARSQLAHFPIGRRKAVRINAIGTPWHESDIEAMQHCPDAAIILPKAEDPCRIASLQLTGRHTIALIETARGLAEARKIAALPNVIRLAFGSVDFCDDLGIDHSREALLLARTELVLASRLAGIAPPIDGVTVQLELAKAFNDVSHARALGMGGKLCIHPSQIAEVLQAFKPTDTQTAWAKKVLAAEVATCLVDGEMVDEAVRRRARSILRLPGQ